MHLWFVPLLVAQAGDIAVRFQINDAMFKGKGVEDVAIGIAETKDGPYLVSGKTDSSGRFEARVKPGDYFVTYRRELYVPIERSPTELETDSQLITATLSMLMEAEGRASERRVKIILNWGSDKSSHARDVDSHLVCPCGDGHVYFGTKSHSEHGISLDVDDMDWGGPETVTLIDPAPGEYVYWVHNFSGSPPLSQSQILVRVLFDDRVAAEYPIPTDGINDDWRPFRALVIDELREPRLAELTPEEIAAGAHLDVPISDDVSATAIALFIVAMPILAIIGVFIGVRAIARRARRRADGSSRG